MEHDVIVRCSTAVDTERTCQQETMFGQTTDICSPAMDRYKVKTLYKAPYQTTCFITAMSHQSNDDKILGSFERGHPNKKKKHGHKIRSENLHRQDVFVTVYSTGF